MKFAARDGSAARTLAFTSTPSTRSGAAGYAAPGWFAGQSAPRQATPVARWGGEERAATTERQRSKPATVSFLRGQEIFTPGVGQGLVYIVRSGCVRLYKVLPDGRSINLGLLGPNTIFAQEDTADGIASGSGHRQAAIDNIDGGQT